MRFRQNSHGLISTVQRPVHATSAKRTFAIASEVADRGDIPITQTDCISVAGVETPADTTLHCISNVILTKLPALANMPQSKKRFIVTIAERKGRPPMTVDYSNLDQARMAAAGFLGCLAPGMGGEVCILDEDGERIQRFTAGNGDLAGGNTGTPGSDPGTAGA